MRADIIISNGETKKEEEEEEAGEQRRKLLFIVTLGWKNKSFFYSGFNLFAARG